MCLRDGPKHTIRGKLVFLLSLLQWATEDERKAKWEEEHSRGNRDDSFVPFDIERKERSY